MLSYPGIYGSGLHVYGRLDPLSDFSNEVILLPTDSNEFHGGMVCTNHRSDNKHFDSLTELVNHVITLWWGHSHIIDYQPFGKTAPWHEVSLEQGRFVTKLSNSGVEKIKILKGNWKKKNNLRQLLLKEKQYGETKQRSIPEDAEVLDLNWPCVLTLADFEKDEDKYEEAEDLCYCEFCVADRKKK
jgi:hypothetical protein